ncbi:unnamed protein product, partial [Iphiclides podalirius]
MHIGGFGAASVTWAMQRPRKILGNFHLRARGAGVVFFGPGRSGQGAARSLLDIAAAAGPAAPPPGTPAPPRFHLESPRASSEHPIPKSPNYRPETTRTGRRRAAAHMPTTPLPLHVRYSNSSDYKSESHLVRKPSKVGASGRRESGENCPKRPGRGGGCAASTIF